MLNQAHIRAAVFHENAAKSHRTAAEYCGNNDRAKGEGRQARGAGSGLLPERPRQFRASAHKPHSQD
jgi:hypothetical protein